MQRRWLHSLLEPSVRLDRRGPLLHGLLLLGLLLAYSLVMAQRTIDPEQTQAFTEAPLILYLFMLLRAPLRDRWWSSLAAALPITLALFHAPWDMKPPRPLTTLDHSGRPAQPMAATLLRFPATRTLLQFVSTLPPCRSA